MAIAIASYRDASKRGITLNIILDHLYRSSRKTQISLAFEVELKMNIWTLFKMQDIMFTVWFNTHAYKQEEGVESEKFHC